MPKYSLLALALLGAGFPILGCAADSTDEWPTVSIPPTGIMAFQSVRQDVVRSLGTPPSEIVLIPNQEVTHSSITLSAENTINGSWFDDGEFTPGIHLGQLGDGTGIVELGWTTAWYQSYHLVFVLGATETGHDVTHLGLLSNGDAGSEWMRVESARVSIFEDGQQLRLQFRLSGDWEYSRDLVWFGGSITSSPSAWAELGVSDLSWGSYKALNDLLGEASPFATEQDG